MMFRQSKPELPTSPVDYPAGTFIHTEKGYFYIASKTKRYRITTERVLSSWRPHRVVKTTEAAVSKYKIAAKMKFRNGSLIWNLSDGKVYLIEEGKRRWVRNSDFFTRHGINPKDYLKSVEWVSVDELQLHETGEDLL